MAPPRKPRDQLQDQRAARMALARVDADHPELERIAPPPKKGWLQPVRTAWVTFWDSDLSAVVERVDLAALERLFDLRDRQVRAFKVYDKTPTTAGHNNQEVVHPMFKAAMSLEKAISDLEDRLGLTPKARAALGIAIGQARITADELNRRARAAAQSGTEPDGEVVDVDSDGGDPAFDQWGSA